MQSTAGWGSAPAHDTIAGGPNRCNTITIQATCCVVRGVPTIRCYLYVYMSTHAPTGPPRLGRLRPCSASEFATDCCSTRTTTYLLVKHEIGPTYCSRRVELHALGDALPPASLFPLNINDFFLVLYSPLPHPYSFASRSHCVPLPDPGPPRTNTTGSFAPAPAPAPAPAGSPSAPSTTAGAPSPTGSDATADAAIDGVECAPLRRPPLPLPLPLPPPPNRVVAPPAAAVDARDDERSSAAVTSARVVVSAGLPGGAPVERPQNMEMPGAAAAAAAATAAGSRVWSPLPLGRAVVVVAGPRKPPRVAVAVVAAE